MKLKTMRIYLIAILLQSALVYQVALSQSQKPMALAKQIYPNARQRSEITIEETLLSIKIAKDAGQVLLSTKTQGGEGHIYLFDHKGNMQWQLSHPTDSEINTLSWAGIKIANSGLGIMVNWQGDYETTHIQFYDNDKQLLFDRLSSHGAWEEISNDGAFIFGNELINHHGEMTKISWPAFLKIPPHPNRYLINSELIAIDAVVKTDIIRASNIKNKAENKTKSPVGSRRPPRGILRYEHHSVFLLIKPNGTVVKRLDLGINGASNAKAIGENMMVEAKIRTPAGDDNFKILFMDFDGNVIWERPHPTDRFGDLEWHEASGYLFARAVYSGKFMILEKATGQLLDSLEFERDDRIGKIIDLYFVDNKLVVSRRVVIEGQKQFGVRIFELSRSGKINSYTDADGLILQFPKFNALLQYESETEVYQKKSGLNAKDFTLKTFGKE